MKKKEKNANVLRAAHLAHRCGCDWKIKERRICIIIYFIHLSLLFSWTTTFQYLHRNHFLWQIITITWVVAMWRKIEFVEHLKDQKQWTYTHWGEFNARNFQNENKFRKHRYKEPCLHGMRAASAEVLTANLRTQHTRCCINPHRFLIYVYLLCSFQRFYISKKNTEVELLDSWRPSNIYRSCFVCAN